MKRQIGLARIGWVLLPLVFAALAGLGPRALALDRSLSRARAALASGDAAAASRHLGEVLQQQPWRSGLWETAGQAALAAGDAELAIERLQAADSAGAITAEGMLALGDAFRLQRDWDAAISSWERALAGGALPAAVYERLLVAHQARGDYRAAINDLRQLVAADPEDPAAQYRLGLLLAALEPESALAVLARAADLDAGLEQAVQALEKGLALETDSADAAYRFFNAGRALAGLGEWTLAAEAFRQAVIANPAYAEAWAFLGEAMQQLGMDGNPMFETALEVNADSLTANLLYALQLRRRGERNFALEILLRTADLHPAEPSVFAEIGQTYADLGQVNDALANFTKAVELAPQDPAYLHLLAMYSIYNEIQVDEIGLPAARAATLVNPEDTVAIDLIGYAYYLQGDWVSGLRFLHRALTLDPNYAPARLHLGMLYLIREQTADAFVQLELAARLAPGSPAAEQARLILETYR